jgi:hypothetical protein
MHNSFIFYKNEKKKQEIKNKLTKLRDDFDLPNLIFSLETVIINLDLYHKNRTEYEEVKYLQKLLSIETEESINHFDNIMFLKLVGLFSKYSTNL